MTHYNSPKSHYINCHIIQFPKNAQNSILLNTFILDKR